MVKDSIAIPQTAFFALKRDAAPGIDGLTWRAYEADLDRPIASPAEAPAFKRSHQPTYAASLISGKSFTVPMAAVSQGDSSSTRFGASILLLHCFKLGQVVRALRFQTLSYAWDPKNPLTGEQASINDLSVHVG